LSQDLIISKVGELLQKIGVAIMENDGTLRPVYDVLNEISLIMNSNTKDNNTNVTEGLGTSQAYSSRGDVIPEEYKDLPRYSFSKMQTFDTCKWAYYLNYIKNEENKDNIWSIFGGVAHDILEEIELYNNDTEKMMADFMKKFDETVLKGYKFSNDDEKNNNMMVKYKTNVLDYFKSYEPDEIDSEEKEYRIFTFVNGHLISGFVDRKFTKDAKYYIQDYKTSSMYTKEGKEEAKEQLIIYAKDLIDKGVSPEDIIICWDFIKYAKITMLEPFKDKIEITDDMNKEELIKNGLIKTKRSTSYTIESLRPKEIIAERNDIGMKIRATLKKIFKAEDIENEDLLDKLMETNDLNLIPSDIIEKYQIKKEKCIVYEHFDSDVLKQVEDKISDRITNIVSYEDIYNKSKDESVWEREPINDKESFYCSSLCGLNHACKYYKDYLEAQQVFVDEEYKEDADRFRGSEDDFDVNALDNMLKEEENKHYDLDELDLDDLFADLEDDDKENKKSKLEEEFVLEDDDLDLDDLFADLD